MEAFQLAAWPQQFVDQFVATDSQRNTLIASWGAGKTLTAICAASEKMKAGKIKKILFISELGSADNTWAEKPWGLDERLGFDPGDFRLGLKRGVSLSFEFLSHETNQKRLIAHAAEGGLLIIVDDADRHEMQSIAICNLAIEQHKTNQYLFICRSPSTGHREGQVFRVGKEFLFEPSQIVIPEVKLEIVQFSPSLNLQKTLWDLTSGFDDLNWRRFEIFVAQLLESDGYKIELMSGTKDGGVDIIAIKDLGQNGMFKALWQAKKYSVSRKIGISHIRELADVRDEHKASKGVIVTSSFLTSGALQRVERDKFILGKVDRNDLQSWIDRKLYELVP